MAREICFIDTEIGVQDKKIYDIGAVRNNGINFHSASIIEFLTYCEGSEFFCGHNIIHHDMKYLKEITGLNNFPVAIDTLYLSPLFFPKRPYHKLLKDDKLQTEELNNPLNDSQKAANLFYDEVIAFHRLSSNMKMIYPNCGGIMYWDGSWECSNCGEEIDSDEDDNDGIIEGDYYDD